MDWSYPMRSPTLLQPPKPQFEEDRQQFYERNLKGCEDYYSVDRCRQGEDERMAMIRRQPASMLNYTALGFAKGKAPESVWNLVQEFWQTNKNRTKVERWPRGSTYGNHWEVPSRVVTVENATLKGGGRVLKQKLWDGLRPLVSEWTGQAQLADSAMFGIRIYYEGAVLAPHVDRHPLVVGVILNVDQQSAHPWPLEVIGHDGWAYNLTIEPGEVILYESHSVIHGRPFAFKGDYFANLFVHYETLGPPVEVEAGDQQQSTISYSGDLPPYIRKGSPQETEWRHNNPNGWKARKPTHMSPGTTEAHQAVSMNDRDRLRKILQHHPELIHATDGNQWTPLHEAVRKAVSRPSARSMEMVRALVEEGGADVNAVTKTGDSVLGLAHHFWEKQQQQQQEEQPQDATPHAVIAYLDEMGAQRILNGQEY